MAVNTASLFDLAIPVIMKFITTILPGKTLISCVRMQAVRLVLICTVYMYIYMNMRFTCTYTVHAHVQIAYVLPHFWVHLNSWVVSAVS